MIQVDVFWSFAIGACFAACASEGLKRSQSAVVNKYFLYTVVYLGAVFAPSGMYLLWEHTGWETMFMYDRSLHGVWVALFACTNVTQGVVGFFMANRLINQRRSSAAHSLWVGSYCCMSAILFFGYDRFLYPGSSDEWNRGVSYELIDFFSSKVFMALVVMSVFVLPPIYFAMVVWPSDYGMTPQNKTLILKGTTLTYALITAAFSAVYVICHVISGGKIAGFDVGLHRLLAYWIGQTILSILLFLPLTCIRVGKTLNKKP